MTTQKRARSVVRERVLILGCIGSAGMWPRALVIAVRWLLRPSRPHAKGSRRERHDAALAPVPRRVRVTRGFDEIVLLVSAFSELPTRHLFSDAVRWK